MFLSAFTLIWLKNSDNVILYCRDKNIQNKRANKQETPMHSCCLLFPQGFFTLSLLVFLHWCQEKGQIEKWLKSTVLWRLLWLLLYWLTQSWGGILWACEVKGREHLGVTPSARFVTLGRKVWEWQLASHRRVISSTHIYFHKTFPLHIMAPRFLMQSQAGGKLHSLSLVLHSLISRVIFFTDVGVGTGHYKANEQVC